MSQDLPPLNALRAFEAAARLHSVSQAAEELHVTHGAVSRQLRTLEEHLGLALFAREGRGLKLTDAGVRLRDVSSELFARLRSTCAELQQGQADAPFVLACPGSLLARWFIPRLDRLNRELPELRLQLSASEGELDPRRPGVDATLWFAEPPWPADMQVYELAVERIGPVLSPRYARFAELHQAPPAALLGEPLLHTSSRPQAWPSWASGNALDRSARCLARATHASPNCIRPRPPPCSASHCCTPVHGPRPGRAGPAAMPWIAAHCVTARASSTSTTCWKRPPLASA